MDEPDNRQPITETRPPSTFQGQAFKGVPETENPTTDNRQPTTGSVPWLKYAEIAFAILVVVNLGLLYFYLSGSKSKLSDKKVGTEDSQGFLLTKPDKSISRPGYTITFSNPRYEHLEAQSNFRVDVSLVNESFEPSIKVIGNCDISENEVLVNEGIGVSVETGESIEVKPGTLTSWTALVILDNKEQKVSSCLYAPEGVFDPMQTIRVVF